MKTFLWWMKRIKIKIDYLKLIFVFNCPSNFIWEILPSLILPFSLPDYTKLLGITIELSNLFTGIHILNEIYTWSMRLKTKAKAKAKPGITRTIPFVLILTIQFYFHGDGLLMSWEAWSIYWFGYSIYSAWSPKE